MDNEYIVSVKQILTDEISKTKDVAFSQFNFQHQEDAMAFAKLLDKTTDPCRVRVHAYEGENATTIYDNNKL